MDKTKKISKIVQANFKGYFHCPFCKEIMRASILSGKDCPHLIWKDSTGKALFRGVPEIKESA